MRLQRNWVFWFFCIVPFAVVALVEPGHHRSTVLDKLGEPSGVARMGDKEQMMYDQVRVVLREDIVIEVHPSTKEIRLTGSGRGAVEEQNKVSTTTEVVFDPPSELFSHKGWYLDFKKARQESARTNLPIFALFTGSDWCPPCMQFESTVGQDEAFFEYARERVVLLKIDFPRNLFQAEEVRRQNEALASEHGIRGFPTFILLDSEGGKLADFQRPSIRNADDAVESYIESMDQMLGGASAGLWNQTWVRVALVLVGGYFLIRFFKRLNT